MFTASLKLADLAARSLFVLLVLFTLPERETGQFGLLLTLVGFFAFFVGFERHADLQRVLARVADDRGDQLVVSTLRLYAVNYVAALPLLAVLLVVWVNLSPGLVALSLVIAVGEHVNNETYRIAVILARYRKMLVIGLIKNCLLLVVGALLLWVSGSPPQLAPIITMWAVVSALSLLALGIAFSKHTLRRAGAITGIPDQFRASYTHFLTGLVAIVSLQADRLIAGLFLPLEVAGVYFRHVFLASVAYQAFGVLSFNRILPSVYLCIAEGRPKDAVFIIRRERRLVIVLTLALIALTLSLDLLDKRAWSGLDRVVPFYLAALMLAFLVRGIADYNALLLNGAYRERDVFRSQTVAMTVSISVSVVTTPMFGLPGLLFTTLLGTTLYAALSRYMCRDSWAADSCKP